MGYYSRWQSDMYQDRGGMAVNTAETENHQYNI